MNISVDSVPILNPFTPLASLPPDTALQVQFGIYVVIGSLGAFLWDIFVNLKNDYAILFKCSFTYTTVIYFLSRLSTLAYILCSVIFETASVGLGKCSSLQKVPTTFFGIALLLTSLLFFFRVRAVYANNYLVISFFALLWMSVAATGLTIPWAVTGGNIGNIMPYCTNFNLASYACGAIITSLIHDSLSFIAISYRLSSNTYVEETISTRVKGFVFGSYLPQFSKLVLQDGQMYYLIAVSMNLLSLIMLYIPNVATTYRTMFTICNIAVTNAVASNVFRRAKFGYIKDSRPAMEPSGGGIISFAHLGRYGSARRDVISPTQIVVSTTTEVALDNLPQVRERDRSFGSSTAKNDTGYDGHDHDMHIKQEYTVQFPTEKGVETSSMDK